MWTNRLTNKQTPLKTSTSLRYATGQLFDVDMLRPTFHVVGGNGELSIRLRFEQPIKGIIVRN